MNLATRPRNLLIVGLLLALSPSSAVFAGPLPSMSPNPSPTPPTPTPTPPPTGPAAATVELIWARTGTSSLSDIALSSAVVLNVVLTAGPAGSMGAAVSVDYGQATATLDVSDFASTPGGSLPLMLGVTTDTGSRVENINSVALPPDMGSGLAPGESHVLGTITFQRARYIGGAFEIRVAALTPSDGVLDLGGYEITDETEFHSAYLFLDGPTATPPPPTLAPPKPTPTTTATSIPSPTPTTTTGTLIPTPTPTATSISIPSPTPTTTTPTPTPTGPPAATIDLIWASTGTSSLGDVALSSSIVLNVVLTAGSPGSIGAAVSVDYDQATASLDVTDFASTPGGALPLMLGVTTNTGSRVENINAVAIPPDLGSGLANGESHVLGTITFQRARTIGGVFEIRLGALKGSDGVLDLAGNEITDQTVFHSAYLLLDGPTATPTPPPTPSPTPPPPTPTPTATPSGPLAQIDLIWERTGTKALSGVDLSSAIVLNVVLTAGARGSEGAGVSVDYGQAAATLDVTDFASKPGGALPLMLGVTTDTGTRVENINCVALPPYTGSGLANGESHLLGTITFHRVDLTGGTFEIRSGTFAATDGVLDLAGALITNQTVFNSAYLFADGPTLTPTATPPLPTPSATPTATPTATPSPFGTAIPTGIPTATPYATPTGTPMVTPTATPNTPAGDRFLPSPTPTAMPTEVRPLPTPTVTSTPDTTVPGGNLVVLRDLADPGARSEQTRSVAVILGAEEAVPGACRPRASAESFSLRLQLIDDDDDVILDETRSGLVCDRLVGQQTFDAPYTVRNCAGSVAPARHSKGAVRVTATTEDGELVVERTIECHP